jgi:hypothetical protein
MYSLDSLGMKKIKLIRIIGPQTTPNLCKTNLQNTNKPLASWQELTSIELKLEPQ